MENEGLLILQVENGEVKVKYCNVKINELRLMCGNLLIYFGMLYVEKLQRTLDEMKNELCDIYYEAAEIVEKALAGKVGSNG